MSLTFLCLGSGTSYGVPMIGCDCPVCRSPDPRNRRTRSSCALSDGEATILIDSSTDLRAQVLAHGVTSLDAVFYTHAHADHLHGIDDLRGFTVRQRRALPIYGDRRTIDHIVRHFDYIFQDPEYHLGWGIPRLSPAVIPAAGVRVGTMQVRPIPILHGPLPIFGYRVGGFAYLTDCSGIPASSRDLLRGLDTLVIDGLRPRPHPMHFSIGQALDVVRDLAPRQTFLTHLTHDVDHAVMEKELPTGVGLAWDGLRVRIEMDGEEYSHIEMV